jgi:hypothetical protein
LETPESLASAVKNNRAFSMFRAASVQICGIKASQIAKSEVATHSHTAVDEEIMASTASNSPSRNQSGQLKNRANQFFIWYTGAILQVYKNIFAGISAIDRV